MRGPGSLLGQDYLTPDEVEKLIKVARDGRRDATLILIAYRHGLRVSAREGSECD